MKVITKYPTEIIVVLISVLIASFIFLPPSVYYSVLGETYYIISFPKSILFIFSSIFTFLIGSFICGKIKWRETYSNGSITKGHAQNLRLNLAIWTFGFSIVFSTIYLGVLALFLSPSIIFSQTNAARYEIWQFVSNLKIGFLMNVAISLYCIGINIFFLSNRKSRMLKIISLTSFIVIFSISYLSQTKANIFLIAFATIIPVIPMVRRGKINKWIVYLLGILAFLALIGYFAYSGIDRITSVNQGSYQNNTKLTYFIFIGYFVAGINKFSALYGGVFTIDSLTPWNIIAPLYNLPLIGSELVRFFQEQGIILRSISADKWQNSFNEVSALGLNSSFNVLSIFGDIYGSFGWLGIGFFGLFGFISRLSWIKYLAGNVVFLSLMPYILFSTTQWLVYNPFFSREFMIHLIVGLLTSVIYKSVLGQVHLSYREKKNELPI